MTQLIETSELTQDKWILIDKDRDYPTENVNAGDYVILPLQLWSENRDQQTDKIGVWLDSDDTVEALEGQCEHLPIIAINFPTFADGRGYSLARQLRDKLGFSGELRAIGDVLKDQLFYYQRSGFSSFMIREDRPAEQAITGLSDFSLVYQPASDNRVTILQKR